MKDFDAFSDFWDDWMTSKRELEDDVNEKASARRYLANISSALRKMNYFITDTDGIYSKEELDEESNKMVQLSSIAELRTALESDDIKLVEVSYNRILINEGNRNFECVSINNLDQLVASILRKKGFIINNYNKNDLAAINLDKVTYQELESNGSELSISTDFKSGRFFAYGHEYELTPELLEVLFDKYSEFKVEYLQKVKRAVDVKQEQINAILYSPLYKITEGDTLLMEVIEKK